MVSIKIIELFLYFVPLPEIKGACVSGLGMEDGRIPDSRITASSKWDPNHGPGNARLNRPKTPPTTGSWSSKTNDLHQWITADLGGLKWVTGVVTQGRHGGEFQQWVTKFIVQYSENSHSWSYVAGDNGQKVRK